MLYILSVSQENRRVLLLLGRLFEWLPLKPINWGQCCYSTEGWVTGVLDAWSPASGSHSFRSRGIEDCPHVPHELSVRRRNTARISC